MVWPEAGLAGDGNWLKLVAFDPHQLRMLLSLTLPQSTSSVIGCRAVCVSPIKAILTEIVLSTSFHSDGHGWYAVVLSIKAAPCSLQADFFLPVPYPIFFVVAFHF
jgi:hypothetical protein